MAATAGIPLTDKVLSRGFTVTSGHDPSAIDWGALEGFQTAVFLMAGYSLPGPRTPPSTPPPSPPLPSSPPRSFQTDTCNPRGTVLGSSRAAAFESASCIALRIKIITTAVRIMCWSLSNQQTSVQKCSPGNSGVTEGMER